MKLFCQSRFPHKYVDLFFMLFMMKDKLTIVWRNCLLPNDFINTFCEMISSTRWGTALPSKVNLRHRINSRALCAANLVTRCSRSPQNRGERNPPTPPCGCRHICRISKFESIPIEKSCILCVEMYMTLYSSMVCKCTTGAGVPRP